MATAALAPVAAALRTPSTPRMTKHRPTTAKARGETGNKDDGTDPQALVDPLEPVEEEKKDTEPEEPELSPTFRNPDGRPSRDNPSVTDAPSPGNAP